MTVIKNRELYRYAVDTFIELLGQVQRRTKQYQCNDKDIVGWNHFVDYFQETNINKKFIRDFALFGIQSWFNKAMKISQKSHVRFCWIFGTPQIKRWYAMGAEKNMKCVRKNLKAEHDIKVSKVDKVENRLEVFKHVRASEETVKQEFHNTKKCLAWCIGNTSLYNHKSSLCVSCDYKTECKEILKNNYKNIYKVRGYGK